MKKVAATKVATASERLPGYGREPPAHGATRWQQPT